jgi:hypothetical protein
MTDKPHLGVAFPELGEGVEVLYKSADIIALGGYPVQEAYPKLDALDIDYLSKCLEHGGKRDGRPWPISLDDVEAVMPPAVAARRVLDAIFLRYFWLTFDQWAQREAEKLKAELEAKTVDVAA